MLRFLTGVIALLLIFSFTCMFNSTIFADTGRIETELSGANWRLWLDREAEWLDDNISLPPVDISSLPLNPPGCGWERFVKLTGKPVSAPGTVEEYYWGANGNPLGTAGDYRGVSWWSRNFSVDESMAGKRIAIAFESVNLRAEVFVNRKLVGYDIIGNTPFEVDVTDAVIAGAENRLDVRVTDPVGNFTWNDNELLPWGNNRGPGVHGFGGITGKVMLRATDDVYISDIHVRNKPSITDIDIVVEISNTTKIDADGRINVVVHEWGDPENILWKNTVPAAINKHGKTISIYARVPKAKPWNIGDPHLYAASVEWKSEDGSMQDSSSRRFGFRWFDINEKNGDERFYLNGKRVFILAAMSRGFWPKNGIFPTTEMAKRDIDTARALGYNAAKFHRAIGQPAVVEYCDEVGHLVFEEPGGYRCLPEPDEQAEIWRREKLRRLVVRDRSHPSLILYNLKNESGTPPSDEDIANMRMVHELDPARIVTYNSDRNRQIKYFERLAEDPIKMHMRPNDDKLHYRGWWDQHHWNSCVGYLDDYYENPRFYLRGVVNGPRTIARGDSLHRLDESEIIFWGEEGTGGSMVSLEKIKNELEQSGATGWREAEHLDYFREYDRFLDDSGFRSSYPSVDHLTMALGRNLHYFHGRIIENVRMSNVADAYILNGWASGGTHSDMVDAYRNPTADPSILAHYTQPLYVAVKIRDKVLPSGSHPVSDIFLINEMNVRGDLILHLVFESPDGDVISDTAYDVSIKGGEEFGQLLVENIQLPEVVNPGYYTLRAALEDRQGHVKAEGHDDIFVVDCSPKQQLTGSVAIVDTSGVLPEFLIDTVGIEADIYDDKSPSPETLILGAHDFRKAQSIGRQRGLRAVEPILDNVANGMTLVILENADKWAEYLDNAAVQYINTQRWNRNGRLFTGKDIVLSGLPLSQAMGWEYQVFYRNPLWGINLGRLGTETIVALAAQHRKEIVNALCRVPYGNGMIYLSTLSILPELASSDPQSSVAKKLLINILEYEDTRQ